ncbi:hypothetical protein NKH93_03500 [Mesorhizobium sp. M0954]|uniref:hypothetical protein n=1 Tax=Mesorhizobium sp. M0954 TaxID=2957032 RepID=UPI0033395E6D
MAVLPAGTGHQCLSESAGFLVVGAYPASDAYDECTTAQEHERALRTIPKLAVHGKAPGLWEEAPLVSVWKK